MTLKVGDKAPDFTLQSDGGGKVSLKDLKGKTVVLYISIRRTTPPAARRRLAHFATSFPISPN
jgi:peroxiredoxin